MKVVVNHKEQKNAVASRLVVSCVAQLCAAGKSAINAKLHSQISGTQRGQQPGRYLPASRP